MNTRKALFAMGCLSLISALPTVGRAQITRTGGGYLFRAKWVAGAKYGYVMDMAMPASQMTQNKPVSMKMSMNMVVKSVSGGVATVVVTSESPMVNGKSMGTQKPQPMTFKTDSRNRVVSGQGGQNMSSPLPEKPIKVGETWSANVPMAGMGGTAKATYTFMGMTSVGGVQAARIKSSIAGQASGSGTMYIAAADGQLLSMNMGVLAQGMKMNVSVKRK